MPKVYIGDAAKSAAHAESANEALRIVVATRMMREGLTQKAIAQRIGLTPVTFSRRLENPDTMTLGELRKLITALKMTEAEAARCV